MIEDQALLERLVKLQEECAEVSQICSKIILWGMDSYHPRDPDQITNNQLLHKEIADITVILRLMIDNGDIQEEKLDENCLIKTKKINNYLQHNIAWNPDDKSRSD